MGSALYQSLGVVGTYEYSGALYFGKIGKNELRDYAAYFLSTKIRLAMACPRKLAEVDERTIYFRSICKVKYGGMTK